MKKVLFLPFNTNHAMIFDSIIKALHCSYEILCHDRISEGIQFKTEESLKEKNPSQGYRTTRKFIANKPFIYYFRIVKTNTIIMNGIFQ